MLTVFNNGVGYPISQDDYYIRELASGYDEVVFNVSIRDEVYQYIQEEAVVRDRDQNVYLIKQIDAGNEKAKVVAQINLDDWKNTLYMDYSNNSATVAATVQGILPTGWAVMDLSLVTKRRTIPTSDTTREYNVTALEILEDCVSVYGVRFRFNTKTKIVTIINPANFVTQGAFATRDLNLRTLNYKGKSEGFATRLYATGADGLTFASINDGKDYVENTSYANKVICAYWSDDRYTDKESLLEDAQAKIDQMAQPSRSYDCDVLDLANTNPEMYGFEDFSLFNVVTLIDDAKGIRTDYQVVERWTYPYYPVNNKVVLSSSTPNLQSAISTVISAVTGSTSTFQQIIQSAIANATALITGNKGGYLVLHDSDDDGTPDELLIMDTPDIATATRVWRWNQAGLGYSNTGYNGEYTLGITMDGAIVADFITAGHINGALITAGTVEANALSVEAKSEFDLLHSYLPFDLFTNINRGTIEKSGGSPSIYFTTLTVEGESKTAIALDGTSLGNNTAELRISTDYIGNPRVYLKYKIQLSADKTFSADAKFFSLNYIRKGQTSYTNQLLTKFAAGSSVTADTEYALDTNFQLGYSSDAYISGKPPYISLGFVDGEIIYLYDFETYSEGDAYKTATLSYTDDGLDSVVKQGSVISQINQSAEQVTIKAEKIDLTGNLTLKGDFIANSSQYSNVKAELKDGTLAVYENTDKLGEISYVNDAGVYTAQISFLDNGGNYNSYLSGRSLSVNTATFDTIFVNGLGGDSIFYRDVKFDGNVYNSSGSVVFVSDRRKKRNIKDLVIEKARSFIMALKPKSFKFIEDISTSNRDHHGFIAQEVKAAMSEDWGVYVEDKKRDFIGLRYDEIIADLVAVVQDQEKRIEALERRLNDLTDNQP